mgnify:CR=1 FL=1
MDNSKILDDFRFCMKTVLNSFLQNEFNDFIEKYLSKLDYGEIPDQIGEIDYCQMAVHYMNEILGPFKMVEIYTNPKSFPDYKFAVFHLRNSNMYIECMAPHSIFYKTNWKKMCMAEVVPVTKTVVEYEGIC